MAIDGLREHNKARRRAAIVTAALELFAERGYAATTIADIAAAAETAPRTVSLYFPTKQDIALAGVTEMAERLTETIRRRLPGEATLDAFGTWLRGELSRTEDAHALELAGRMFAANPDLKSLLSARLEPLKEEVAGAIAAELGVAATDLRVQVVIAALGGVVEESWTAASAHGVDASVDAAVRFLKAGMVGLKHL